MLFTQFNIDDALEVRYEEGLEDGQIRKLIQQVCKKLPKCKSPDTIAEELEEELPLIQKVFSAIEICGMDADPDAICRTLQTAGTPL